MSEGGTDASISRGTVNMALDELLNHQDSKNEFDKRYDILRDLQALPSGTDHSAGSSLFGSWLALKMGATKSAFTR
jgi:hypothetical protein